MPQVVMTNPFDTCPAWSVPWSNNHNHDFHLLLRTHPPPSFRLHPSWMDMIPSHIAKIIWQGEGRASVVVEVVQGDMVSVFRFISVLSWLAGRQGSKGDGRRWWLSPGLARLPPLAEISSCFISSVNECTWDTRFAWVHFLSEKSDWDQHCFLPHPSKCE